MTLRRHRISPTWRFTGIVFRPALHNPVNFSMARMLRAEPSALRIAIRFLSRR